MIQFSQHSELSILLFFVLVLLWQLSPWEEEWDKKADRKENEKKRNRVDEAAPGLPWSWR